MESHRENVSSRVPRIPDVEERDGLADKGHRRWNRPDLKREIRAEGGRGQKEPCSTIDQGFATMAVEVRLQQNDGKITSCRTSVRDGVGGRRLRSGSAG